MINPSMSQFTLRLKRQFGKWARDCARGTCGLAVLFTLTLRAAPAIAEFDSRLPNPEFNFAQREMSREVLLSVRIPDGFEFKLVSKNFIQQGIVNLEPARASSLRTLVFQLPTREGCSAEFEICRSGQPLCERQRWNLEFPSETQKAKAKRAVPKL